MFDFSVEYIREDKFHTLRVDSDGVYLDGKFVGRQIGEGRNFVDLFFLDTYERVSLPHPEEILSVKLNGETFSSAMLVAYRGILARVGDETYHIYYSYYGNRKILLERSFEVYVGNEILTNRMPIPLFTPVPGMTVLKIHRPNGAIKSITARYKGRKTTLYFKRGPGIDWRAFVYTNGIYRPIRNLRVLENRLFLETMGGELIPTWIAYRDVTVKYWPVCG